MWIVLLLPSGTYSRSDRGLPVEPANTRMIDDPGEATMTSATSPGQGGATTVVVSSTTGERSETLDTVTSASAEFSHQCWSAGPDASNPVEPVVTTTLTGVPN